MIVFNNGEAFEHKQAFEKQIQKDGRVQQHLELEVVGEFADIKAAFTSGEAYAIRVIAYDEETGEEIITDYDKSAFNKCASIRDNMGDTCTVDMYQLTNDEKVISEFAVYVPDDVAANHPTAYEAWRGGVDYKVGDRVNRRGEIVYKCINEHTSQDIYPPEIVPALWVALDVTHAGTADDAIPAVRGMEYTYGLYYYDSEDGNTYLCSREGEADGGTVVLHYMPHELVGQYFVIADVE